MNLIWIVFIFATAAVGVYLYAAAMQAEKLKGRPGGERIDLRPDGTIVPSDPASSTPGDIGYVAPPAHHYSPEHSPSEIGGHHAAAHSGASISGGGSDGGFGAFGDIGAASDSGSSGDSGGGNGGSGGGGD